MNTKIMIPLATLLFIPNINEEKLEIALPYLQPPKMLDYVIIRVFIFKIFNRLVNSPGVAGLRGVEQLY